MIAPRKQKIVGFVLGVSVAILIVASLVYLFATGSSLAIPTLLFVVGSVVAGASPGYLVARFIKPRETLAGRLILGGVLAVVALSGLFGSAVLPELFGGKYTGSGAFVRGLTYMGGLVAFFRLVFSDRLTEGRRWG